MLKTYWLYGSKKVIITNTVIRQASTCDNCVAKKPGFSKQKPNKKNAWDKIDPKFFIYQTQAIIKHLVILFELQK